MAIVASFMYSPQGEPVPAPAASQTDPAGLDAVVERLVEFDEGAALRVVEVHDVGAGRRVVALADQLGVGVLEGGRHVQLASDAQEQRARVSGQPVGQVSAE